MIPFDRIVIIEKKLKIPIYRQIAVSITNAIRNGILNAGAHLPGSSFGCRYPYIRKHRQLIVELLQKRIPTIDRNSIHRTQIFDVPSVVGIEEFAIAV